MKNFRERTKRLRTDAIALGSAVRLVPGTVFADCRSRAEHIAGGARVRRMTRMAILATWLGVLAVCALVLAKVS